MLVQWTKTETSATQIDSTHATTYHITQDTQQYRAQQSAPLHTLLILLRVANFSARHGQRTNAYMSTSLSSSLSPYILHLGRENYIVLWWWPHSTFFGRLVSVCPTNYQSLTISGVIWCDLLDSLFFTLSIRGTVVNSQTVTQPYNTAFGRSPEIYMRHSSCILQIVL